MIFQTSQTDRGIQMILMTKNDIFLLSSQISSTYTVKTAVAFTLHSQGR
jgi:hypothetical protein